MAETYTFFNSVNGDRVYDSRDFARYFAKVLTNGVFPKPENNLKVTASTGMEVQIQKGAGYINGYAYETDGILTKTIEASDPILKRKDIIVLRLDLLNRKIEVAVKKGTPASSPVAPTLTRTANVYELCLGEIAINAKATSITQANITDTRLDTTRCGFVSSLIEFDTTSIFEQYLDWFRQETTKNEKEWNEWIDALKEQIANDDHTQINERIDAINNKQEEHGGEGHECIDLTNGSIFDLPEKNCNFAGNNIAGLPNNFYFTGTKRVYYVQSEQKMGQTLEIQRLTSPNSYEVWVNSTAGGVLQGWERVETFNRLKTQSSYVTIRPTINTYTNTRVYFEKPYTAAPQIRLGVATSAPNQVFASYLSNTTSYVDIGVYRNSAVDTIVSWEATERTQAPTANFAAFSAYALEKEESTIEESPLVKEMFTNGGSYAILDDGTVKFTCLNEWHILDKTSHEFFGDQHRDTWDPYSEEFISFFNYMAEAWKKLYDEKKEA